MEDVRFYDFDGKLLHVEHDILSCFWTLYENEVGTFEMHFPLGGNLTEILTQKQYLIAIQGDKQAIVTGRQLTTEGVLYGKSCNWILTRFCIFDDVDTDSLCKQGILTGKDAQTVCAYLIKRALGQVDCFVFETCKDVEFGEVQLQVTAPKSLFELLQSCAAQVEAGHRVFFDVESGKWFFSLTKGRELPIVLSEDNQNVYDFQYTEDLQDYFTGGYYRQRLHYMGSWNAESNEPFLHNGNPENYAMTYRVVIRNTESVKDFGLTLYDGDYIICDNKNGIWKKSENHTDFLEHIPSDKSGIYAWEAALSSQEEADAHAKLKESQGLRQVVLKTRDFLFGRDYLPGDSVLCCVEKGQFHAEELRRIVGTMLWYEPNRVGEQPIFKEGIS